MSMHEESLLDVGTSLDDDETTPDSGLLYEQQYEKFGIINAHEDVADHKQELAKSDVDLTTKANSENASLSSSTSGSSAMGSHKLSGLSQQSTSNYVRSSSSEPKDTSDSERIEQFKAHLSENYTSLGDDKDHADSASLASDSSSLSGSLLGRLEKTPKTHIRAASSPVSTHHIRHVSQDWVTFDDCNSKNSSNNNKPPDIPSRKAIPSTSSQLEKEVDLLSMDEDLLNEHLVQSTKPSSGVDGPPIPERLMSPNRSKSESTTTSPAPKSFNIRLPPPHALSPASSLKRRARAKSAATPSSHSPAIINRNSPALAGPPVPPRKDISSHHKSSTTDALDSSDSSLSWVKFDSQPQSTGEPSVNAGLITNQAVVDIVRSSASSLDTDSVTTKSCDTVKDVGSSEECKWVSTSATSPTGSLRSSKKKKGGYQHLQSDSDEETKSDPPEGAITIKVTDLSPIKPLSRWAPIPNDIEDQAGSSGNVSAHNSLADDEPMPDDLGLDDVFGLNRLSTDMSDLKGFNRDDKGSQNNLVDFSESAEKLGSSVVCEGSSADDGELETVFDMSAQGDSLKRRRKKRPIKVDRSVETPPTFNIGGTDSSHSPSINDVTEANNSIDLVDGKFDQKLGNISTNPFWSQSPLGDTVSVASSTSESNPFERVQFQSTTVAVTPIPAGKPLKSTPGIPTLPPPPGSGKARMLSGSLRKRGCRSTSSRISPSKCDSESDHCDQNVSLDFSCEAADLQVSSKTPTKSDNVSLLDLTEESDKVSDTNACKVSDGSLLFDFNHEASADDAATPGTSTKDPTILETTLSILDVFSTPSEVKTQPVDVETADAKTCQAMQMAPAYPDLRESSLDSLEKLQKAISVESPEPVVAGEENVAKKLKQLKGSDVIPSATEWNMLMRFPRQKRVMSSRKWVNIYVRLKTDKVEHPTLQLYHNSTTRDPFYFIELDKHDWQLTQPVLQPRFQSSDNLQNMEPDAVKRKVHSVKILHVHYKERHAFSSKHDKFVTREPFGFKHSLKGKQAMKLGTEKHTDLLSLLVAITDAAFIANRGSSVAKEDDDHTPTVKYHSQDEIVFDMRDEFMGIVSSSGEIEACNVTVHLNATSFLSGDPKASITFNDKRVEGREVVKRADIVPSSNDGWVNIDNMEVHKCSTRGYDYESAAITFYPPDSCRFELARFNCPYNEKEPPVTVRASVHIKGARVSLRCNLRSSGGHSSNKDPLTQVPCEDLSIRFHLPQRWVPAFRKIGRIRMKSVHAKRIIKRPPGPSQFGNAPVCTNAVLEASVGSAKYECAYGAVVWRVSRFPEKNAAQNTPQVFSCTVELASDRELPCINDDIMNTLSTCYVEYTMPSATASGACVRSVNLPNTDRAEKFACYSAHYLYKVGMVVTHERDEVNSEGPSCAVQ